MSTTTENFLEALSNHVEPEPIKKIYRLYYSDDTILYSQEELDGNYIDLTPLDYAIADKNVYVKDGVIHRISIIPISKLVPSDTGIGTDPNDITLIDSNSNYKWEYKQI